MMKKLFAMFLIVALAVPAASAVTVGLDSDLDEEDDTYVFVADDGSDAGVFEESNGCDGLQTEAGDCDDDGEEEEADNRLI